MHDWELRRMLTQGSNFSFERRYDEKVMVTRTCVFTPKTVSINLLTSNVRLWYGSNSKPEIEMTRS